MADTGNHRILRVRPDTTNSGSFLSPEIIAGTGSTGFLVDNGLASGAQLNAPNGLAVGWNGVLYVADSGNSRIRCLIPNETGGYSIRSVQTVSGTSGLADAIFTNLRGVALDFRGRIYVSADAAVRRIDPRDSKVEVIAGIPGQPGYSRDGFKARSAKIRAEGIALDLAGNLYLAEGISHRIRRVDAVSGIIATIAGTGVAGSNSNDADAFSSRFNNPTGLAIDANGTIYVIDSGNQSVRSIR